MFGLFKRLRPAERTPAQAAFVVLSLLVGSHAVLETARDALFLEGLPASRLPLVYLMIAGVSLAITELQGRWGRRSDLKATLGRWTVCAAAVTSGLWALLPTLGNVALYALYVWSGVLTTLILVHFWTLLGEIFSVTEAKRVYSVVGLGSVVGAIGGSAAAGALVPLVGERHLLILSVGGLLLAALASKRLRNADLPPSDVSETRSHLLQTARHIAGNPYAVRVVALSLVATMTVTVADYLFKSEVAAQVPPQQLGSFFAWTYLALNAASFGVQLALVGPVVRRVGVVGTLLVLPWGLLVGSATAVVVGGLAGALVVKASDGALRHTLHRTASELLFVPLGPGVRVRLKSLNDVVGQRGGQALASLGILAVLAAGASTPVIAILLAGLAVVWIFGVINFQPQYVELFRRRLRADQIAHLDAFPELDVASLEALIAALDSPDDRQVIAALEVLENEGKGHLIPTLIFYHPSVVVVRWALAQFVRLRRGHAVHTIDRLLDHTSPDVRGAAIAARSVLAPDSQLLRRRLNTEESAAVRAVIMVNLIASGAISGHDASITLNALIRHGQPESLVALADGIALRQAPGFNDTLVALAATTDAMVRQAAARAMGSIRSSDLLPTLVHLLADEHCRRLAAASLLSYEDSGLQFLTTALQDLNLPRSVRWRVPNVMSQYRHDDVGNLLLEHLAKEEDGLVRYSCIVALEGAVRRRPDLPLEREQLLRSIRRTVARAYRYVDRRVMLARGAAQNPARGTEGHALLDQLLRDKGANAIGRMFRLLGLLFPAEDLRQIQRGLTSPKQDVRSSSLELLEALLHSPLREAVIGLVDDIDDEARLVAGRPYHTPLNLDYEQLLQHMLDSTSESVQTLTVFHIGELRLLRFKTRLVALSENPPFSSDARHALAHLEAVC